MRWVYMITGRLFEGKYEILKVLGKGGTGTVYLARNVKLGTLWAIKEIKKGRDIRVELLAEPHILKRLRHPALPRVFDIIEDDRHVYTVVDYMDGVSLDRELARAGKFDEKTVIGWALQLCDVLNYLHGQKPNPIIYRDLKPSNIILSKDGSLKLIDFGTAREYKSESDSDTLYIGTRGYAAPEQYGFGQTSMATDIYSLGVTMHQLLTGKDPTSPPFEIKPVRYYDKSLSPSIEHVIAKCTRTDPKERYASSEELMADLARLIEKDTPDGEASHGKSAESVKRNLSCLERKGCRVLGFKKQVLAVWGSPEFACELAYTSARLSGLSVLLLNMDFTGSDISSYIRLDDSRGRNSGFFEPRTLLDDVTGGKFNGSSLYYYCVRKKGLENLHIIPAGCFYGIYEYPAEQVVFRIIDSAYDLFDLVVVIASGSMFDPFALKAAEKSHCILVPLQPSMDSIEKYRAQAEYLEKVHGIPSSKVKWVFYEYKKGINPPMGDLRDEVGAQKLAGFISYSPRREMYRNMKSTYSRRMEYRNLAEYEKILEGFGILPRKTAINRLKDWLLKRGKDMARSARKGLKRVKAY